MPKMVVSVIQRPPTRSEASISRKLRPAAETRRAAAIPAEPAPTITTSKSTDGDGAAIAGAATVAAEAARNERRLKRFMVGEWLFRRRAHPTLPQSQHGRKCHG